MKFLQQSTIGNNITIGKGDLMYSDSPVNFEKDMGFPAPQLPGWAEDRVYEVGKRHAIHTRDGSRMEGGEEDWEEGNRLIEDIELAIEAKDARIKEAQETERKEIQEQLDKEAEERVKAEQEKRAQDAAIEKGRPRSKTELAQISAQLRSKRRFGGFESPNYGFMHSDANTLFAISNLILALEEGVLRSPVDYKAISGWITVDLETLKGMRNEIIAYTQESFMHDKEVNELIETGRIKTLDQLDGAWL